MKIKFRIVDDLEELKVITKEKFGLEVFHVYGFFQLCFGEHKEGCYYHNNPLRTGEVGGK